MDKIKNVLHGHKKDEDVAHDSHHASSTTGGQEHPIYDQMTSGQTAGHNTAGVSPYANVKTTSGEPYTALAQHGSSTHGQSHHVGTGSAIGSSATTGHNDYNQSTNQTHAKNGGEASKVPLKVQEKLPESVERAVPNAIHDTGDNRHDTSTGHSSTAAGGPRPDANPTGRDHHQHEMSTASIKSGVIGFGPNENQGHAARSTHNPSEQYMERDQVLGGGNPGSAAMTEGQGLQTGSSAQPYSQSSSTGHERATNLGQIAEERPYDNTLRQESYTADTDRSFPLAGGVASRPHDEHAPSSTRHATQHTSTTQHSAAPTSTLHDQSINEREPGTKEREAGVHEGHGREGLAGAAAAATGIGAASAYSHRDRDAGESQQTSTSHTTAHPTTTSHNQSPQDEGILAKTKRLVGLGGSKDDGTHAHRSEQTQPAGSTSHTQDRNPAALAGATAAASNSSTQSPLTQRREYGTQASALPGSHNDGMAGGDRPLGQRNISYRHVPGEFVTTPHEHKGTTYLEYYNVVEPPQGAHHNIPPSSSSGIASSTSANVAPGSSLGASHATDTGVGPTSTTGQHDLRHTGTLDEPRTRSSGEHHLGRDAAIAGGLGAGAAGLGAHATSHGRDAPDAGSNKALHEESSPYSSKRIDPRVLGGNAPLGEQRFDPQAKSGTSPHHASQTSSPAGMSSAATSGPSTTHDPARAGDSQHHYGRDAALVGAGAATAGGLHHANQRNDTPGTGTAVLPQDSSYTSPTSGYGAPQQSSNMSGPSATTGAIAPQQGSGGNNTFYGTPGAPAPVVDRGLQHQQPSSTQGNTSTTGASTLPEHDSQHHYGRDAALGGAGLAAAGGGLYAANRGNEQESTAPSNTIAPGSNQHVGSTSEDPASKTIGPHKSNVANILDPRVKPDPSKQKEHTTSGPHQSDTFNKMDPKVDEKSGQHDQHHYGRDAAAVGGTGAAGYGAYEAAKAYGDHRMTQPGASMNEQRYDPTARTGHGPNPIAAKSEYDYNDPTVQSNVNRGVDPSMQHDSHRNAALGTAAGLGAAGVAGGAYAGSRHGDNTQQLPIHGKQSLGSSMQPGSVPQSTYPAQGTSQSAYPMQPTAEASHPGTQSSAYPQDPVDQNHNKRNAALAGGAGAAAAGGAAYAYSQQDDHERARLEERQQELARKEAKEREHEQHRLDKEHAKEQHKLEKEEAKHAKEAHKHDKSVAAHEKEEHRLQKEKEKEEARRQKEAEKEAEGEKKKGGLLGFLHRDKSKKEKSTSSPESSPRNSRDYSPRHSKEYAAGGAAVGAGTTVAAYGDEHPDSPRYKGKNLLHKDPPPGHPAREALEHQHEGGLTGKREHIGVDGPIGDPNAISGDRETKHGVYGAHPTNDLARDSSVIEPHTGLPMNVGRYGEGAGGTDGNTTIHGADHHHGVAPGQTGTGTNWEAIRKADTPY